MSNSLIRRHRELAAALLALALCGGCLNVAYIASAGVKVDTLETGEGTAFKAKVRDAYGFWGLRPPIKIIEVDREVARALGVEVQEISGLRITRHLTVGNAFVQTITLGLYNPRTLVIEGHYK